MVHEKPDDSETWTHHTVGGWYIDQTIYHYIYYKVWIKETRAERIVDTIAWFPSSLTMHISSSVDRTIDKPQDLTRALANPYPVSQPTPIADNNSPHHPPTYPRLQATPVQLRHV